MVVSKVFAAQLHGCRSKCLEQPVTKRLPFLRDFWSAESVQGVVRGLVLGRGRERRRLRQFALAGLQNVLCCVSEGLCLEFVEPEKVEGEVASVQEERTLNFCWPNVLIKPNLSVLRALLCWSSASALIWSALCVRFASLRTVLAAVMVPVYTCGNVSIAQGSQRRVVRQNLLPQVSLDE